MTSEKVRGKSKKIERQTMLTRRPANKQNNCDYGIKQPGSVSDIYLDVGLTVHNDEQ